MDRKVVLVTGASSGIGYETIKLFASHNYNVVINYNKNKENAEKLQKYVIDTYRVDALVIKADISCEEEVNNMVSLTIERFGKIDCLVNNASIAIDTLFEDKTIENFKKTINVNLVGTFYISKLIGDIMYKNKYGTIINISSTNGIDTYYPMSIDYDASKAGVISLTHNLAVQYKPYIRVNCVAPGWVNTPMNSNLDKDMIDKENEKIYLNRFGEAKEIANVIYFLASDGASYINNEIIRVDGGCGI